MDESTRRTPQPLPYRDKLKRQRRNKTAYAWLRRSMREQAKEQPKVKHDWLPPGMALPDDVTSAGVESHKPPLRPGSRATLAVWRQI